MFFLSKEPIKKIAFCSSQRFRREMTPFIKELRGLIQQNKAPFMILEPDFDELAEDFLNLSEKDRLKNEEYRKQLIWDASNHLFSRVKKADTVFIYNKNGYVGVNTSGELFAAAVLDKKIYALEEKVMMGKYPDELYEEPFVSFLISGVTATPQDFFEKINQEG